ncbi:MAG: hypothetical protein RLZZ401_960 [Pseudomonadota bacterium]
MGPAVDFVCVDWSGRTVHIEYQWIAAAQPNRPLLVFLHEGLGSLAAWKTFPQQLCNAAGYRGLVYSRPGYGRSTPREADEHWGPDFMHRQAHEVLPALLDALHVTGPVWLLGHSDGGSIALLHAASHPARVAGCIVLAPHIMVEAVSIASIAGVRENYLKTDLRQRLTRYHDDPDSAFWGWNDIWLHPSFRGWSIETAIEAIRCPLLAVQGADDEYGSLAQIHGIARRVPHAELLELKDCGHSPHRDQPDRLISAACAFMAPG